MRWPWKQDAEKQKAALAESAYRKEQIDQNWGVIWQEVVKARRHRSENHIADLVIRVARGNR